MAIASTIYAASICLFMLFSMQAMLRLDLCTEFGTVGHHIARGMCYSLTVIFLIGVIVESGRLVVAM